MNNYTTEIKFPPLSKEDLKLLEEALDRILDVNHVDIKVSCESDHNGMLVFRTSKYNRLSPYDSTISKCGCNCNF